MSIPLADINKAISSLAELIKTKKEDYKRYLESEESSPNKDSSAYYESSLEWIAEINEEIDNLKLLEGVWLRYKNYEEEKVQQYKKRLWTEFYEDDLSEEMKEKINPDKTIDFRYP